MLTIRNIWYKFNVHGSVNRKNILIFIQQDATLHSLFYLETALHVSGGTITHHQERKQLYLKHLVFATPLLLPAAITAGSSKGAPPETVYHPRYVEQFPDKINCVTLHLVGYILEYDVKSKIFHLSMWSIELVTDYICTLHGTSIVN